MQQRAAFNSAEGAPYVALGDDALDLSVTVRDQERPSVRRTPMRS
jgi:hypothetical protein